MDDPNRDAGRVYRNSGILAADPAAGFDPPRLAELVGELLRSQDPDDRGRAYVLVERLSRAVALPAGMWCVAQTYVRPASETWLKQSPHPWSAHYTREEAETWLPHWQKRYADRNDYAWQVIQLDDVPPYCLRRPDADPARCMP